MASQRFILLGLIAMLLLPSVLCGQSPTVIYVNATSPPGGNGRSWETAFSSLDDALAQAEGIPAAQRSVQIWMAAGTYVPTVRRQASVARSVSFQVRSGISILGGFSGSETDLWQRRPRQNRTVLSGDLSSNDTAAFGARTDNAFSVIYVDARERPSTLDGLIIRGGFADGISPSAFEPDYMLREQASGGGLLVAAGIITVNSCEISDNHCKVNGGGIFFYNRTIPISLTVANSLIVGNRAQYGSAVTGGISGALLTMTNCVVADNLNIGGNNGVIYVDQTTFTIQNTLFGTNRLASGAAVANRDSLLTGIGTIRLRNCMNAFALALSSLLIENSAPVVAAPGFAGGPEPYALAANSAARDSANPSLLLGFYDLSLNRRAWSSSDTQLPDIGALEFGAPSYSPRLHVISQGPTGLGTSWQDALVGGSGLKTALSLASQYPGAFSELWVARGVYRPSSPIAQGGVRGDSFVFQDGLAVYGGFQGNETALSQRPALPTNAADAVNPTKATVLSGDLNGDDLGELNSGDNAFHVVRSSAFQFPIVSGVTITAGNANAASGNDSTGGGVFIVDAPGGAEFRNVYLIGNRARAGGGGANILRSFSRFVDCIFESNFAGATRPQRGAPPIEQVTGYGGAIQLDTENTTRITGTIFRNNEAQENGGAIAVINRAKLEIATSSFVRNSAGLAGGGAFIGRGATSNARSDSTFVNCSFTGNYAADGSAITTYLGGRAILHNALMVGNIANGVGAVYVAPNAIGLPSQASLSNSTLAFNQGRTGSTSNEGAGITVEGSTSSVSISSSLIWANGPKSVPPNATNQILRYTGSEQVTLSYSSLSNWNNAIAGAGNNALDPLFIRLPSRGPDDEWGTSDDDYGDLRLSANSPAIDSGDSLAVPSDAFDIDADSNTSEALPLDITGNPRFYDDPSRANTGNGSPPVDRGAFESNLALSNWLGASGSSGNGVWGSAANWSGGVPTSTVRASLDATLPPPLSYSITMTGAASAYSLTHSANTATLNLTGGNMTLFGSAQDQTAPLNVTGTLAADPRLTIRNTGVGLRTLAAPSLDIARTIGSTGRVTVTGTRITLDVAATSTIGLAGAGALTVRQQGAMDTGSLLLGSSPGSTGQAVISDPNSVLALGGPGTSLVIGGAGSGSVSVTTGGTFGMANFADLAVLGQSTGGSGTLSLSGANSVGVLQSTQLVLGDFGAASLSVTGGASLFSDTLGGVILARQPGSSATVTIGAGSSWTETTSTIVVGGQSGSGNASVVIEPGGQLIAPVGTTIQTTGTISGSGTIASSVFNLGTIRPGQSPGTLTIDGSFRQLTPPAVGGAPLDSGKLELEVAGDAPGQADRLIVTGPTELGGGLFINFLNNYRPAPGSSLGLELVSAGVLDPEARFDVAYLPPVLNDSGVPDGRFLKVEYPPAAPLGIRSAGNITLSLGSLGSPITYLPPDGASVDGTPTGVAIGDLNGDGLDDLAISVPSSANPTGTGGSVVILINRGGDWQGFPSAGGPGSIQLATGREPRGVVIADLDNDGRKDLAVANASSDTVSLFANTTPAPASASFASAGSVSFLGRPVDLVADNFNGPDRVDLAVACEDANLVSVRRAVGVGFGFDTVAVSISTGNKPRSVAAFNPDQDKDVNRKKIAVANFASNTVGVINTSAGTVGGSLTLSPLQTINVAPGPVKVIAQPLVRTAGVNRIAFTGGGAVGQGRSVLVTVNQSAASSATASVIAPNPDPATQASVPFNPAVDIPAGLSPRGVIAADLDADLDDELVIVTNVGTSASPDYKLRVLRNDLLTGTTANQQLAFVFDRDIDAGVNPLFLVQGQLVSADPSAPRDLVTVNDPPAIASSPADAATLGQEPNIRPLRNRTMPPQLGCSPADIANTDGEPLPDGVIDNGDFTAFFGAFFLDQTDPARLTADIADTDGATTLEGSGPDGVVDNGDFTAFFNFFFQGCGVM